MKKKKNYGTYFKNVILLIGLLAGILTLSEFVDDKWLGDRFTIIPDYEGLSIITSDGKSHFEVGDKAGKIVGAVPTQIQAIGGQVVGYSIEVFDESSQQYNYIACKDEVRDGGGHWCACQIPDRWNNAVAEGGWYSSWVLGCAKGYTSASECGDVCNPSNTPKPNINPDYVFTKDTKIRVKAVTKETVTGHVAYSNYPVYTSEFVLPVYEPETVDRYLLPDCQTTNPDEMYYCKGICENNICNIKSVITEYVQVEDQEFESWKPLEGKCEFVKEKGRIYFESKEECLKSQGSIWYKIKQGFISLYTKFVSIFK